MHLIVLSTWLLHTASNPSLTCRSIDILSAAPYADILCDCSRCLPISLFVRKRQKKRKKRKLLWNRNWGKRKNRMNECKWFYLFAFSWIWRRRVFFLLFLIQGRVYKNMKSRHLKENSANFCKWCWFFNEVIDHKCFWEMIVLWKATLFEKSCMHAVILPKMTLIMSNVHNDKTRRLKIWLIEKHIVSLQCSLCVIFEKWRVICHEKTYLNPNLHIKMLRSYDNMISRNFSIYVNTRTFKHLITPHIMSKSKWLRRFFLLYVVFFSNFRKKNPIKRWKKRSICKFKSNIICRDTCSFSKLLWKWHRISLRYFFWRFF